MDTILPKSISETELFSDETASTNARHQRGAKINSMSRLKLKTKRQGLPTQGVVREGDVSEDRSTLSINFLIDERSRACCSKSKLGDSKWKTLPGVKLLYAFGASQSCQSQCSLGRSDILRGMLEWSPVLGWWVTRQIRCKPRSSQRNWSWPPLWQDPRSSNPRSLLTCKFNRSLQTTSACVRPLPRQPLH